MAFSLLDLLGIPLSPSRIVGFSIGALLLRWVYLRFTAISIADIPGPGPESFWLGNLRQLMGEQAVEFDKKWQDQFGGIVRFKAPLAEDCLLISDPKAIQYILQTSRYRFVKPYGTRFLPNMATGKGVHGAEGADHHCQRRILLVAFGSPESQALMPIFKASAQSLVQLLRDSLLLNQGSKTIDMSTILGRATLDSLGKAAFEYDFGALHRKDNELADSLHHFTTGGLGPQSDSKIFVQGVMTHIPAQFLDIIAYLRSNRLRSLKNHVEVSNEVARKLLKSKAAALEEGRVGRDILSLIVRANAMENEKLRLTDEELLPQVATILGAGYETITKSLVYILCELAKHSMEQGKLREELQRARADARSEGREVTTTEMDELPYFNAVIKETLRFDTVVPHLSRKATQDDVLPLSKPISATSGKVMKEIPIRKGLRIIISDVAYNFNKDIWGEDADVWRPERWLDGTFNAASVDANVGVFGNLMSFGTGHRACLGWRFAVTEMQTFLFELITHLTFDTTDCARRTGEERGVTLPTMAGGMDKGNAMPLKVSLADCH
ncbi:cytochrome P450 [Stereum hirsutum FP-91666 SS1]|uniref:cytochrome P450 n=1 Tax=Stereum hirsutum (strain FP-91666) TaxID=721885 RepID=UPI000440D676|nr:cytochrome P450 [Stereum hirsutum FP-91666 SS1]EIM88709.1 cytochrome P450 [Stereum hirsutum FP-91666 SS1]